MARTSRSKSADPDVTAADRGEAAKALSGIGIEVYDQNGQYQDFTKTLDELAERWDILTDAQRANIAEGMAGVRNINVMQGIIETWKEARQLAQDTNEDPDYYLEVQDKWMESMTAKLNTLQASIQEFWNTFLDTGTINVGIDAFNMLVQAGQGLISIFKSIGDYLPVVNGGLTSLAGTAATIYAGYKIFSNIKLEDSIMGGLTKTKTDFTGVISSIAGGVKGLLSNFTGAFKEGFSREMQQSGSVASAFFRGISGGSKSALSSLSTMQKTVLGIGTAFTALYIGVKIFDQLTTSSKEAAEAAKKASEEYASNKENLESTKATVDGLKSEFRTLSEGVEISPEGAKNISLTSDEFERYKEICNEIADIFPDLVNGYDAQGNAILNLKDGVSSLNEEYEKLLLSQERDNLQNLEDYQEDFNNKTGNGDFWTKAWDSIFNFFNPGETDSNFGEKEALDTLNKIQDMTLEEAQKYYNSLDLGRGIMGDEGQYLRDLGFHSETADGMGLFDKNMTEEEFDEIKQTIIEKKAEIEEELTISTEDMKSAMQSYLRVLTLDKSTYPEYADLDNSIITNVSALISKASTDQLAQLEKDGVSVEAYVKDLVDTLSNNEEASGYLNNLLSIDEDTTIEEQKKIIKDNLTQLSDALKYDDEAELKVKLGLEDSDELISNYDDLVENINKKIQSDGKSLLEDLINTEGAKINENIDLFNRPQVDYARNMHKEGWKVPYDDENSNAYYTKTYSSKDGSKSVVLTPILPNGEVVDEKTLNEYAKDLLDGKTIDADVEIATFDGKDSVKQAEKFSRQLQKASKYFDLSDDRVKDFLKDNNINTQEEIDLLNSIINKNDSWADVVRDWEIESFDLDSFDEQIENLEANLEVVKTTIDNINSAIDESHTSVGLSGEAIENVVNAFSGLEGYDYDHLFESTAAGVHLNVQEMERLNGEYEKAEKQKYDTTLEKLRQAYADTCVAINETTSATERSDLVAKRDGLIDRIQQTQELQSRYEGLTSAVTKWQNAVNGTEEGDVYDSITSGVENIKELYDQGLVGTREFKAGVQMMTNEDLSGASIDKYLSVYKNKIKEFDSYFNENGTGVENFLKKLQSVNEEWAHQNKDGSWSINANIEDMAKELDLSQSAITEIFKKLNDYGFDVDFIEETDQLKSLREEAEKASKSLDKKYKLDLSVTNTDAIQEQIDKGEEFKKTLDETSDEYKAVSKQVDYLKAKAGAAADALNFNLNYNDNKDEIDKIISSLKDVEEYADLKFDFDTTSVTNVDNQIEDVQEKLLGLKNDDGKINLQEEGAAELVDVFQALINYKQDLSRPAVVKLDSNDFKDSYQDVMVLIQNYQAAAENLQQTEYNVKVGIQTEADKAEAQKELDSAIAAINNSTGENKTILAKLGIKPGSLKQEEIDSVLSNLNSTIMIRAGFTLTEEAKATLDGVTAAETKPVSADTTGAVASIEALNQVIRTKEIKPVEVRPNTTTFDEAIANRTKTSYKSIVVNEVQGTKVSGGSRVNGNVNFSGSAYANGTVGAPKDEVALVGEEKPELRINRKDGSWELLGKNGAEFTKVNKGDLIFNGDQTEQLFKYGKINSRGKAFINGTVGKLNSLLKVGKGSSYASGTYTTSGSLKGSNKFYNNYNKNTNKKKNNKSNNNDADEFLETIDWVEIMIDRIERKIQELDTIASSAYKSYSKRNSTLTSELSKVTEEINLQQKAYDTYIAKANSINLSSSYKEKVRNGTLKIEDITDEDLKDRIDSFQEWYEKALDTKDTIVELKETLGDLASQKFDNVVSEYDSQLEEIEHRINQIETGLDIVEAKGQFASRNYFDTLMSIEQENINKLSKEYTDLQNAMNTAMREGNIQKYSEQWYDMTSQINDVSEALLEAQQSLIEYKNEMREMDWSIFDKMHEYISEISKESDFLIELLSFNESELFDKDTGFFTDKADSIAGLRTVNYDTYMAQADMYRKKVEELNEEIAKDPTNTILLDKKNEYLEAQRESILNANEEKKAVIDLISESYDKMLEILDELIQKRKDALEAEKNLYEYEQSIKDQTKEITDYEKQLSALAGDDSEEAQSKRQQIQTNLEEAQQNLQEMEYDQWLSDQQKLLDDYYSEYELFLNERLDQIDLRFSEIIDSTNANSATIDQTIKDTTSNVGYQITDGMKSIWSDTGNGIGKVVSDYSGTFVTTMTTTNSYIQQCVNLLNQIVNKANAESSKNTGGVVKPTTSSGGSSSSSSSKPSTSTSKPSSSSSSSKKGDFFVYKKDSYPKNKLQINTSIVDRLNGALIS